jgi:hypothetical protein
LRNRTAKACFLPQISKSAGVWMWSMKTALDLRTPFLTSTYADRPCGGHAEAMVADARSHSISRPKMEVLNWSPQILLPIVHCRGGNEDPYHARHITYSARTISLSRMIATRCRHSQLRTACHRLCWADNDTRTHPYPMGFLYSQGSLDRVTRPLQDRPALGKPPALGSLYQRT